LKGLCGESIAEVNRFLDHWVADAAGLARVERNTSPEPAD
jgi:hypothetical protein